MVSPPGSNLAFLWEVTSSRASPSHTEVSTWVPSAAHSPPGGLQACPSWGGGGGSHCSPSESGTQRAPRGDSRVSLPGEAAGCRRPRRPGGSPPEGRRWRSLAPQTPGCRPTSARACLPSVCSRPSVSHWEQAWAWCGPDFSGQWCGQCPWWVSPPAPPLRSQCCPLTLDSPATSALTLLTLLPVMILRGEVASDQPDGTGPLGGSHWSPD